LSLFASSWEKFIPFAKGPVALGKTGTSLNASGGVVLSTPGVSPAYMGVGYIIGPRLASLNFAGGLLAWGLFVPLLLFFLGPTLETQYPEGLTEHDWLRQATIVWQFIVRPIAIGGMLMSAVYTLYRMRKNLFGGLKRSISDVKKAATGTHVTDRTETDLSISKVFVGIGVSAVLTFFLYNHFAQDIGAALTATVVMVIAGFFFAAVSGYLVGLIGSSNNPISGLTLSTVIVAAILMVALGQTGVTGVAAVLGVAGVICVSAAVAGEMLQDLKVGHILGGTPWKMQVGDLIGVIVASAVMIFPIIVLHEGDIKMGGTGLGGRALPAPQASLMALVSQGIVGGQMAWPLIIVGILMAIGFILVQVKSPMLVCVGMYLPLETTFAIFIGGLIKGIVDKVAARRQFNDAQKVRVENNGTLLAAGLIAGEALIGLVFAALAFWDIPTPAIFENPSFIGSLAVFLIVGLVLVLIPVRNAGKPDEPAPPSASF
jgi:putative OPT family oligopeptide transporter